MLTTLDKTKQALLVVHMLDGDPSGIKEKIDENIEEEDLNSEDGISNLLEFLTGGQDKLFQFQEKPFAPSPLISVRKSPPRS